MGDQEIQVNWRGFKNEWLELEWVLKGLSGQATYVYTLSLIQKFVKNITSNPAFTETFCM